MAVAETAFVNAVPVTGTSITSPSITTPATNPVLVVSVGLDSATAVVNSLTLTGFSGTSSEVKNVRNGNTFVSIWVVAGPTASTAGTVKANLSASVPAQLTVTALSGADQTTPCPTTDAQTASDTGAGSQINRTVTPLNLTANDATVGAAYNTVAGNWTSVTTNSRYVDNAGDPGAGVGDSSGTTGVSWVNDGGSGGKLGYVAARVKVPAGGAFSGITATISNLLIQNFPYGISR